jgi:uncharacterized protein YjdB
MQKITRSLLLVGLAALGMSGCGDKVTVTQPTRKINSVTVTPSSATIRPAQTLQLDASVNADSGLATSVNWVSSTPATATVGPTGVVTGVAAGTTTITATSTVDAGKKGASFITVQAAQVTSVTVQPTPTSIAAGRTTPTAIAAKTQQLVAVVTGDAGVATTVTWTSSNTALATVSTTGLVTANALNTTGTLTITATSTADATKQGIATVNVTSATGTGVASVTVTPSAPTIQAGFTPAQTVPLTAIVAADAAVTDLTVTWSTTDPTKATVSATGVVTAVAAGNVAIIATSNADATKKGAANVTVLPPPVPATVSVDFVAAFGTLFQINVNNVFGQIDAHLTIDPGGQSVTKVELLIDGVSRVSQNLSPSFSLQGGGQASLQAPQSVVLSYNTGNYVVGAGNQATVDYLNGPHTLSAKITTSTGSTAGSASSQTQQLQFNNANAFHITHSATAGGVVGVDGFTWFGGPANATFTTTAVPVMYDGRTITSVTIAWTDGQPAGTVFPCPTNVVAGGATPGLLALLAPPAPVAPQTACTGSPGGGISQTDVAAPFVFTSTVSQSTAAAPYVVAAVASDGNPVVVPALGAATYGQALLNTQTPIRIDNTAPVAPPAPTFTLTAQGGAGTPDGKPDCCSNNWIGAAAAFNWTQTGVAFADAGVGIPGTPNHSFSTGPVATALVLAACAAPVSKVGAEGLAETTVNNADSVVVRYCDRLGNSQLANLTNGNFGVDLTAPTFALTSLPTANDGVNTTPQDGMFWSLALPSPVARRFNTLETDGSLTAAPSGFGVNAILLRVRVNFRDTTWTAGVGGAFNAFPMPGTPGPTGGANDRYLTFESIARDQAGNRSTLLTRTVLIDETVPVVSNVSIPAALVAGASTNYSATITDNIGVGQYMAAVDYCSEATCLVAPFFSGNTSLPFALPVTVGAFGTQNVGPIAAAQSIPFVRSIERVVTPALAQPPVPQGAANNAPSGVLIPPVRARFNVFDVAGNVSTQFNTFALGTPPTVGTSALALPAGTQVDSITISNSSSTVVSGGLVVCAGTAIGNCTTSSNSGNANFRTVTVTAWGPATTFPNPFATVYFLATGANGVTRVFATSSTGSVTDNGLTARRTWVWTATYNPLSAGFAAFQSLNPAAVFAIGVRATGEGLMTSTLNMNVQNSLFR